jgi:hypothetical protein
METVDETGNKVIIHPSTPNLIIYAGSGRPCPICKCFFMNSHDFALHQTIGCGLNRLNWRPSKFGDNGKIVSANDDPKFAQTLQQQGTVTLGYSTYSLSPNKKWIIQHPVTNR